MKKVCIQMRLVKILIRLRNAQSDLNLRWAHISEGTFSDVAAHNLIAKQKSDIVQPKCSIVLWLS